MKMNSKNAISEISTHCHSRPEHAVYLKAIFGNRCDFTSKRVWSQRNIQLYETGFYCIPVSGDGNCLFRAISMCAFGNENNHISIR